MVQFSFAPTGVMTTSPASRDDETVSGEMEDRG